VRGFTFTRERRAKGPLGFPLSRLTKDHFRTFLRIPLLRWRCKMRNACKESKRRQKLLDAINASIALVAKEYKACDVNPVLSLA
jgi:hypothetical protein